MEKTGPGKPSEERSDGAVNLLVSGRAIDAKQAMRFTGKFTEEEIIDILSHRKILHYIHMHHHLGYYNYTTQARIINRERTIILTLPSNRSESYRYSGRVQHLFCVTRGRQVGEPVLIVQMKYDNCDIRGLWSWCTNKGLQYWTYPGMIVGIRQTENRRL